MTLNSPSAIKTTRLLYPVRINYKLTLSQMIALGNYKIVDSDILAENFPLINSGQTDVDLAVFLFDRRISTAEITIQMGLENCDPAKIEHLLAYGAKYPEMQKQFPISALCSVWRISINLYMVPTLDVSSCNWRSLKLDYANYTWDEGRGFLAVARKQLV